MEMNESIWMLRLAKIMRQPTGEEAVDTAELVFSTKEKLEQWLLENYFVFGYHPDFVRTEAPYWFHLKDEPGNQIEVWIKEKKLDDEGYLFGWW